jgi:RHS repeat-associated protein
MDMPGRQYNAATGYRYGFNGKEKDNKDGVVQYDYGMRIYDPRLMRFKSVDPLMKSYPMLTPYQYASNRPIDGIDLDGMEYLRADEATAKFHSIQLKTSTSYTIQNNKTLATTTVTGISSAQGELNLANCSGWLRDYCNAYNGNMNNWHDENGNKTMGTKVTWLGAFYVPVVADKIVSEEAKAKKDVETYAKSPLSQYGRGTVPNVPNENMKVPGSAGNTMTGGGKIGGALEAATYIAQGYAEVKTYLMNSEAKDASKQYGEYGWRILTRLQYAIEQNLIPEQYNSMTQIANYFFNGTGVEGTKLKEFAQKLWNQTDNLYYEEKVKKIQMVGDGNSGNTGTAPKPVVTEVTVQKKI